VDEFSTVRSDANGFVNPGKKHIVVVDSRDFIRGCVAGWLREFHHEFDVSDFSCVLSGIAPEVVRSTDTAIIGTDAVGNREDWLARQAASLRQQKPDLPIVLLAEDSDAGAVEAFITSMDLQGYIPTSSSMPVVAAALRLVLAGGTHFGRAWTGRSIPPLAMDPPSVSFQSDAAGAASLTPREKLVFELLARGVANKIIAFKLGMSINTVKIHVHHIIRKLGVRNRTQVAVMGWHPRVGVAIEANGHSSGPRLFATEIAKLPPLPPG
jgi:DNA-binding NarL/FixJ family response regulator